MHLKFNCIKLVGPAEISWLKSTSGLVNMCHLHLSFHMKVEIGGNNIPPIILNDVISSEFRFRVYREVEHSLHTLRTTVDTPSPHPGSLLAGLGTASLKLHAPFK